MLRLTLAGRDDGDSRLPSGWDDGRAPLQASRDDVWSLLVTSVGRNLCAEVITERFGSGKTT